MLKAVYLDLDGVLVDLVRHTYRIVGIPEARIGDAFEATDAWDAIDKVIREELDTNFTIEDLYALWAREGQEFWASVPWTSHGKALFDLCSRYAPVVLMTTPTIEPSCAAGKMEWIQRNLPKEAQRRYALSPCKHHMAHPGALLIDDGPHNTSRFEEHGGSAILWPGPWNETGQGGVTHDQALTIVQNKLIEMSST